MFPDKIYLEQGQDTPGVIFSVEDNQFLLTGRSFPADADSFYQHLIKWLDDYKKAGLKDSLVFDVKMEYFNTASAKLLLDIFFKLEDISESGYSVSIKWHFLEEDEDMQEAGEEFDEIVELDFEFVEIEEE